MKNSNKAFTLVELIVVIVILAILSTIAFLSFNSYSSGARDSVRLSDMTNISKGLVLYYTNSGKYPIPDNYITITASGTSIGYQGYAGSKTLEIANVSSGKDPLDTNTYYTYNTNINQNKYQLMGFLEDGSNSTLSFVLDGKENGDNSNYSIPHLTSPNLGEELSSSLPLNKGELEGVLFGNNINLINKAYSDSNNYSKRFPYTKGDQLGILLNSGTQLPVQYNNSGTGFELTSATGTNYIAYINKTIILQSTGSMIGGLAGFYTVTSASSTYPGCDTPDIKLSNGQVWSACNIGATISSNGWNNVPSQSPNPNSILPSNRVQNVQGNYYQWGRNDDVTFSSWTGIVSLNGNVGHNYFISGSVTYGYDWIQIANENLWGGLGTTSTGGTYYTQGQPSSMQGPCASGYHVPTIKELFDAINNINPSVAVLYIGSQQNDKSLNYVLKLPLSGRRYHDANYYGQGLSGWYWTSSPNSGISTYLNLGGNSSISFGGGNRTQGFSIRCLKN